MATCGTAVSPPMWYSSTLFCQHQYILQQNLTSIFVAFIMQRVVHVTLSILLEISAHVAGMIGEEE